MELKRTHLMVALLLFMEVSVIFYTANYTFRTKSQAWTYESDDEIACISITPSGSLLGIGGKNGSIVLISRGRSAPYWEYHGKLSIISIKLSYGGDYLVAMDSDETISLFSRYPHLSEGEIYPLWHHHLQNGEIRDIYSSKGIPPIVYVLASKGGNIHLISRWGEELWQYQTGAEDVVAAFSRDGKWIAAGDAHGNINLFRVESDNPLWSFPTGLEIVSIAVSFNNEYLVAGGETEEGKGGIYLLSLRGGELIYNRQVDQPIRNVYISHDGESVIIEEKDGDIVAISYDEGTIRENPIHTQKRVQSIVLSDFGSYVAASNSEGEVYLSYLPRPAPLWRFKIQEERLQLAITQRGESVYVSDSHQVYLLSNRKLEEMIPGSRIGWAIAFSLGVGIALFPFVLNGKLNLNKIERGDYLGIIIGFSGGTIIGLLITNDIGKAVLLCGVSSFIGSLFSWRGKSILSFLSGSYAGFIGSGIAGFFLGLLIWFSGDERTLVQLMLDSIFNGFKMGVSFGPLGAMIGTFLRMLSLSRASENYL